MPGAAEPPWQAAAGFPWREGSPGAATAALSALRNIAPYRFTISLPPWALDRRNLVNPASVICVSNVNRSRRRNRLGRAFPPGTLHQNRARTSHGRAGTCALKGRPALTVRAYELVKRSGVRTGSVITDIAVLLVLLAWAWALIGWRALREAAAGRRVRVPFWAVILGVWPFTWLLRVMHLLPQSNVAGLVDSTVISCVIACLLIGQRRQRDRDRQAWTEQMAARRQQRPAGLPRKAPASVTADLRDHDWFTARLDEHDWQLADQARKIGEFLWIAREAAARAGIEVPATVPGPGGKPELRIVRDGEAS